MGFCLLVRQQCLEPRYICLICRVVGLFQRTRGGEHRLFELKEDMRREEKRREEKRREEKRREEIFKRAKESMNVTHS